MKKRQFLAALLALACAASMAVPAFAADTKPALGAVSTTADLDFDALTGYELDVETEIQKPVLKVTLPASTSVLVNPYRIEVDLPGGGTSFDTVLSPDMEIVNNSGCAIKVGVKGILQTYTVNTNWATDKANYTDVAAKTTNISAVEGGELYASSDNKTFYDKDGRAVTVKFTAGKPTATPPTDDSYTITSYTASKSIKVATAAFKDVDAEKGNSLFMYVEGKQEDGEWATAFDAKKVAGVKDTKTGVMSTTGMMLLSAKETTSSVLYLGSGEKGYTRVTGQAATAPTVAWSAVTDKFDAKFTFVVDAVANAAPSAPLATDIKVGGTSIAGFEPTKLSYDITANSGDGLLVVAATTESGATTDITVSGNLTKTGSNIMMTGAGTGTVTIAVTKYGLTTTYTLNVTIS